jgi:hypothetical protein
MALSSRAATVHLPLGQLALVGFGVLCITNPEKVFTNLAMGIQLLQNPSPSSHGTMAPAQPIIIHHGAPAASGSKAGFLVKIVLGAGLCWGSYAILVAILPDSAQEHLPVSRKVFNQAVTSLGRAVLSLKDTLMEQIHSLSLKQDELGEKQDKTHSEVLDIKDNVQTVRGDIMSVQEALDLCQASLSESERRTTYIARGVQLLTRGVSTILPHDEYLLNELAQYNLAGEAFRGPAPIELRNRKVDEVRQNLARLEEVRRNIARTATPIPEQEDAASNGYPSAVSSIGSPVSSHNVDPENDHPEKTYTTPASVENSVAGIHTLLKLHSVGNPRRTHV